MRDITPPDPENAFAEADVLGIATILSDTCRQRSRGAQIQTLMEGLRALVNGKSWVWGVSVRLTPDSLPTWLLHGHGGFTRETYARFIRAQEHPDLQAMTAPYIRLLMERGSHLTRLRQQTDPEDRFATSGAKALWDEAGVAPGILSCRPLPGGEVSVAAIYRAPDAPFFTERERRISHLVLSQVSWLHLPEEESVMMPARRLSPRCITVFNLMLEGHGRREIATQLGIREGTVHTYAKEVFRHFSIHSQAELIARFREGWGE